MNTKRYLFAFDFDRTIADTFQKSPTGIGVNEATLMSVKDILEEEGLTIFNQLGGLKNRAPSELISLILQSDQKDEILSHAKRFLESNKENLLSFVPEGKGIPVSWNNTHPEKVIGELFVRQKLSYLLDQIGLRYPDGETWPPPCRGFIEFWQTVEALKQQGVEIDTAIISSGHDEFINKVFRLWKLNLPDILVTEDDIRGREQPKEIERRVKPGQLPLALGHQKWLHFMEPNTDYFTGNRGLEEIKSTRERMIYFGDDPNKDGGLAGGRLVFGWFNSDGRKEFLPPLSFSFRDWRNIAEELTLNKESFKQGRPVKEILLLLPLTIEGQPHSGVER